MHANTKADTAINITEGPSKLALLKIITNSLDDNKAEDINTINLSGKSGIADFLVIASGRSQRQVSALAHYAIKALKESGVKGSTIEGLEQSDWVLIDAGDVVVHIFRPEVRSFYNLDKMWETNLESSDPVN